MGRKLELHEHAAFIISHSIKIIFACQLFFLAIPEQNMIWIITSSVSLFLSLLPTILRYLRIFTLPGIIDLMITLALFLHTGVGEMFNVYFTFPNFDMITHYFSGFIVAFLIFMSLYLVDLKWDEFKIHPYAIAIGTVIGTMAMGVIWEWFEWLGDYLFHLHSQVDLFDTMVDLAMDTLGGITMAIIGIYFIGTGGFKRFVTQIEEDIDDMIKRRNS